MRTILFAAIGLAAVLPTPAAGARNPGFDPRIVAFGEDREQIRNTPITQRPNRPLHVYGNTVRRRHERGVHRGR